MPVNNNDNNSEKIIECPPPPTTAPLQITCRHYIDGCMHLPDLSNGECRTSNKCDHSELFWLEIQRNGNSWFSIFSGKHWQHYLDDCYVSTNWVLVDCSVGLFFFFQQKNGREDSAINRVGIWGKNEVGGGLGGGVIKWGSLYSGLEIETDTVANVTKIFCLTTKNAGLVAEVATRF